MYRYIHVHVSTIYMYMYVVSPFPGGSVVSGTSMASLGGVAGLLGLEVSELQRSLTSRVMTTTKGGAVGTIIKLVPL